MRFLELHLDGFGKLVNRAFSFAPGLNLVFGPNEAGKSTLQHALVALLYGFYDEGSVTRARQETVKILTPWAIGADFAGWLTYQLDDGRVFRAVRSFSGPPVTQLESSPNGQDASSEYRSASHGRLFFADAQLGMGKTVFENTCVVRQAELVALELSARAITDTLMRLSASASQDTTTADALALLEKALRDEIGTDRAWTKPLAQARQRLEELQAAQAQATKTRREAFALIAELNQEQAQLETLDVEIERLRYLATLAERQAIQAQLEASTQADAEAKRLEGELERWKPWADFPAHLRDQVIRLEAERTRLAKEIAEHADRVTEVQRQRTDLADRLSAAGTKVAALADACDVPAEQLPQVQKLAAKLESAQAAELGSETRLRQAEERLAQLEQTLAREQASLGGIVSLGPVGLVQLQQRWLAARQRSEQAQTTLQEAWAAWNQVGLSDEQYNALAETARRIETGTYVEERPRKGCRFWGRSNASQAPPPEAAIYAQVKPIRDRSETARAEAKAARDDVAALEDKVRQYLNLESDQQPDQTHFDTANQRLAENTRLSFEVNAQREAVISAQTDAQGAHRQAAAAGEALAQAITALGYATGDLEADVRAFEQMCQRKAQYDHAATELQRLRGEDRLLAQEEQAQMRREEALRTACQSLRAVLTQAGITVAEDNLPGAAAQFEERYRHHQQWLRAQDKLQAALVRPASGLTQSDRETARKRLADLTRQLKTWQAAHSEWGDLKADHDAHDYRERSRKLEVSRQAKQERCTQLRESLQRMTTGLSHPAELAEQIATAQAQVRRLEHLRDVLTLARDELEAATQEYQRAFAPRVERLMAEGLAKATHGRYAKVTIDPATLAVTLVAPERSEPVAAALLSTGTRDLVYLLLRIGIARLMSRTGETLPLLLDDPLVQFDRVRQQQMLEYLAKLAEDTQVFFFTKDEWSRAWFERSLGSQSCHGLHVLVL